MLGQGAGGRVQRVDRALLDGPPGPAAGFLDRAGQSVGFTRVGQDHMLLDGPLGERLEQPVVSAGAGQVVLATRPHRRGPPRPPVRRGAHLPGAAVMMVRARLPQVDPRGRAYRTAAVGADQCAGQLHLGVSGGRAASSAPCRPGAAAASTSMPSCRYR